MMIGFSPWLPSLNRWHYAKIINSNKLGVMWPDIQRMGLTCPVMKHKMLCLIFDQDRMWFVPYFFIMKVETLTAVFIVCDCKHLHSVFSAAWQSFKWWNKFSVFSVGTSAPAPVCCVSDYKLLNESPNPWRLFALFIRNIFFFVLLKQPWCTEAWIQQDPWMCLVVQYLAPRYQQQIL